MVLREFTPGSHTHIINPSGWYKGIWGYKYLSVLNRSVTVSSCSKFFLSCTVYRILSPYEYPEVSSTQNRKMVGSCVADSLYFPSMEEFK